MQKHKINCHHCGLEFESSRSDAMYCSLSCKTRASQIRSKKKPGITISFAQDEFEELTETAKEFNLSVDDLIKYRSMITNDDLIQANVLNEELVLEKKKLKAELSLHTKTKSDGIYLDIDDKHKQSILKVINSSRFLNGIDGDLTTKIFMAVVYFSELEKLVRALPQAIKNKRLGLKTVKLP